MENRETIRKCVADEKNEKTIIAGSSYGEGNKRIQAYPKILSEKLSDYQEKLFVIQDGCGKSGLHPLTPSIRNQLSEHSDPPEVATKEGKH